MKTLSLEQQDFKKGLQLLEDDSKADFGSARRMLNVMISDRGGITTRPGTSLLGARNESQYPVRGLFNFKKSQGEDEILTKFYDDEMEAFDSVAESWYRVKNGFTSDQEFGYTSSLVNTDNDDFMYFCNRTEDYQRWRGSYTRLNGALSGAETDLIVDSTLKESVYYSATATGSSATTLVVSTATWVSSMWVGFYIHIVGTGKVRKITSNNGTTLTFDTLGADPGSVAFEIRALAFPPTGTVIYDGTNIAYTGIDTSTSFQVASAHAGTDNAIVAIVPTPYISAPRGNRIENLLGRVFVGNVRSAVSRDSAGALQGTDNAGSVFVSKILNPTDFTFSATRVANEGDILSMPYGGGEMTDIKAQEDVAYVYKKNYIEAIKYSGDTDDFAIRTPLKTGVGSVAKVIKGRDDHFFMTSDNQYTSIGRVHSKDILPQTENIGHRIKRLLDVYEHSNFNGIEFQNRILSSHKESSGDSANNVTLVYNKETKSFEGVWSIGANNFEVWNNDLYYGESNGANIRKMFTGKSDVEGTTKYPVTCEWQSNFFNALPIKANIQSINSIFVEGYIKADTTFTFELFKDFLDASSLSFNFSGTETDFLAGNITGGFLGGEPIALQPLGSVEAPDNEGRSRFSFIVYFPYIHGQYFSTAFSSNGIDQDWEIIRVSLGLKEDISTRRSNTKVI